MQVAKPFLLSLEIIFCLANGEEVSLLFVGDVSFSVPVRYYVEHGYHTYNDSFSEVAPYIRNADISVANLESPFVSKETYRFKLKEKFVVLDASADAAAALRISTRVVCVNAFSFPELRSFWSALGVPDADQKDRSSGNENVVNGFDAVTLANNHFNDFGANGAKFTIEVLRKTGIKYFGVSYGEYNTSQEPLIVEAKGIKIGFLGYCDSPSSSDKNCSEIRKMFSAGPAVYSEVIAIRDVNNLRKAKVDVIIAFIHFGVELHRRALPYQIHITEHLMSLGVQVIIGAHPHVLQQHCLHDNKLVAYSLGNFLFHPRRPWSAADPAVYGGLGKKPNKNLIDSYEHFALGNSENLKMTQMLKVTLSRNGVLRASYLPVKIIFDFKTKRIHPQPMKNAKWIRVCGKKDTQCERSCKNALKKKRNQKEKQNKS